MSFEQFVENTFNYELVFKEKCIQLQKILENDIECKHIEKILQIEPYYTPTLFYFALEHSNLRIIEIIFKNEHALNILFQTNQSIRWKFPSFIFCSTFKTSWKHPLLLCMQLNTSNEVFIWILNFMLQNKEETKNIYVQYSEKITVQPLFYYFFVEYQYIGSTYKSNNLINTIETLLKFGFDINEKCLSQTKEIHILENNYWFTNENRQLVEFMLPYLNLKHYINGLKDCFMHIRNNMQTILFYMRFRKNNFLLCDLIESDLTKKIVILTWNSPFHELFYRLCENDINVKNWFFNEFLPTLNEEEKTWMVTKINYNGQTIIEIFPNNCKTFILNTLFQNSFIENEEIIESKVVKSNEIINQNGAWYNKIIKITNETNVIKYKKIILQNYLSWFPKEMFELQNSLLN